jgi:hypothetical protein
MEEARDPVVLNIYELTTPEQGTAGGRSGSNSEVHVPAAAASWFQSLLTPMGLGAYHTSLDVHSYTYTYGAGGGIQKTLAFNKYIHIPRNAVFKQSLVLGSCTMSRGQINECLNKLRTTFTGTSYHLLNRNCNHFTETFATAIILGDQLLVRNSISSSSSSLQTYPPWVNRLAKSGTAFIDHGDVCNVFEEAKMAAGVEGKVGWDLSSSSGGARVTTTTSVAGKQKKELTPVQKAALAKLKKNKP